MGAPIVVATFQRLLGEQPSESRAVDEQVSRDRTPAFERYALDETGFSVLLHGGDLSLGAGHATRHRELAQVSAIERRIEVKGIGDGLQRRARQLALGP